jgi:hypothetical protein
MSLILEFENAVLALEERVGTEDVFAYTNMVLKGFIRNGVMTEEYIALAKQAMSSKQESVREDVAPPSRIILTK